jgi:hypothetical protein
MVILDNLVVCLNDLWAGDRHVMGPQWSSMTPVVEFQWNSPGSLNTGFSCGAFQQDTRGLHAFVPVSSFFSNFITIL